MKYDKLWIWADGSSKGNPGPSGSGTLGRDENGRLIFEDREHLGEKRTNNEAELHAIVLGLKNAKDKTKNITIYTDSKLSVKALRGEWEISSSNLSPYYHKIKDLEKNFDQITYEYKHRSKNKEADALANAAARIKKHKDMNNFKNDQ